MKIEKVREILKDSGLGGTYFGIPLEDFEKNDLIRIINQQWDREQHLKDIRFISELR